MARAKKRAQTKRASTAKKPAAKKPATKKPAAKKLVRAPKKPTKPSDAVAELHAKLLKNPRDPETLVVYADALQEAGDPRGELIALQLARGDGKPSAREKALEDRLWKGELAPLRELLDKRHSLIRNGFLKVARLTSYREPMTAEQIAHSEWPFVSRIEIGDLCDYPEKVHEPVELVSRIPHLEELSIDSRECLAPFIGRIAGHGLAHLGVFLHDRDDLDVLEQVVANKVFPELRSLATTNYEASAERLIAIAKQLTALERVDWFFFSRDAERDAAHVARSLGMMATALPGVGIGFGIDCHATLVRDGKTSRVTFTVLEYVAPSLITVLRGLGEVTVAADGTSKKLRAGVDELVAAGFTRG